MKKLFVFIALLSLCVIGSAQTDQKYALTSVTHDYGVSIIELLDAYLSPLSYTGIGLNYQNNSLKFVSPENTDLSMQRRFSALVGMTLNPQYSASMAYIGTDFSWGMHYHFRLLDNLQVLTGGLISGEIGYKSNARNVNNPINVDLSTNINLSASVRYDIPLKNRVMRLNCGLEVPVIGCMFVPQGGASYYEMFELWNLPNTIHFSSLHNKIGLSTNMFLDVPFQKSTWRFGISSTKLKYEANSMIFNRNNFNFMIGCAYNIQFFKGMKNQAPVNFIDARK